jgi:sporulation protein YlmC with PRC-barrel domain
MGQKSSIVFERMGDGMRKGMISWGLCIWLSLYGTIGLLNAQSKDASPGLSSTTQAPDERKLFLYSGSILDRTVTNPQGDELGRITQLVLDAKTGQVTYVTLAVSGMPDLQQRTVLVPWQAVEVTPDGKRVILRTSKSLLQRAPSIDAEAGAQQTN